MVQAKKNVKAFFERYKRRFKLITYPAGTLTVTEIRQVLDIWERQDGFVPDVIIIDYADLMSSDDAKVSEFRHRQDYIWKSLRGLSQERHVLVVTATQADSESYEFIKNLSDCSKIATALYNEGHDKLAEVFDNLGLAGKFYSLWKDSGKGEHYTTATSYYNEAERLYKNLK